MGMFLKKIELINFRNHKHFIFEPDRIGVTCVSGSNGAGKSSIVDAFAWALFGTKPNNIKNKMLINEEATKKDDKVEVVVELQINKVIYKIQRAVFNGGGAECNVYSKNEDDTKYNHLAGPGIKHAESFVKQIIRMDEKGFLTAIMIQQKQVDQIVSASPRERGEVIEKLTGIQSITNAIDLAKEEVKVCQQAANLITVENVSELKDKIVAEVDKGKQLRIQVDNEFAFIEKRENELTEKKREIDIKTTEFNEAQEINTKIKIINEKLKFNNEELTRLTIIVSDYKKNTKSIITDDVDSLSKKADQLANELFKIKNDLTFNENEKNKFLNLIDEINQKISNINKKDIKNDLILRVKEKENLETLISKLTSRVQSLKGEEKQVKKSLETFTKDTKACPVCKSHIENPDKLKEEIKNELNEIKVQQKDLTKEIKTKKDELNVVESEIITLTELEKCFEDKKEYTSSLKQINKNIEALKSQGINKQSEYNAMNEKYKNALEIQSKVDEVERAKQRIHQLLNEINELQKELNKNNDTILTLNSLTKRELTQLNNEYDKQIKELNKMRIEANKNNEMLKYLREKVETLKENYKKAKSANDKYNELMSAMRDAQAASVLMSEFKETRMNYAKPTLEMYASTILNRFTNSKFVKLHLDNKYNPFVTTSDGIVRPSGKLSGGELSAVAIALRIGISMLLNGGEQSVLILDEILVSMDEARARHIIETITSISNCQVIFIAHNTDIQSVADKIVQV